MKGLPLTMKSNMPYRVLALALLLILLFVPVAKVKATAPGTTIYLPVAMTGGVDQARVTAATNTPAVLAQTLYLPLITQTQNNSEEEVTAAWLSWSPFFSFGTNTYSVKIEKRHFDAGGDGQGFNFLDIPLLIDLYNTLTVPDYATQKIWGIKNAALDKAQTVVKGTGVVVAVVDTGFSLLLNDSLWRTKSGYDFVENDPITWESANWWDDDRDGQIDEGVGHGTFISSLILASTRDTRIMPVRVLNSDGSGTAEAVAKGIRYAADRGVQIINLSLSGQSDDAVLREAITYAANKGVVLIAAAASNSSSLGYPAAYPQVIAVGAIDQNNTIAKFALANASQVDVFAPGDEIYGIGNLGARVWMSGNSMAAAFVSAEAALLMSGGKCQAACVRAALTGRVQAVSPTQPGRGRIDAYAAVRTVQ